MKLYHEIASINQYIRIFCLRFFSPSWTMIVMHHSFENTYITYFTSQFPARHRPIYGESSVFLAHVPLRSHLGLFHLLPNPTTLASLLLFFIWGVRDYKLSNLFLMNYKRSSEYQCRNFKYSSPKNPPNYSWNDLINWLWCRKNDSWLFLLNRAEQNSSYGINMLKVVYILAKTATIPSQWSTYVDISHIAGAFLRIDQFRLEQNGYRMVSVLSLNPHFPNILSIWQWTNTLSSHAPANTSKL